MSQLALALAIGYKNNSDVSRIENGIQWPDAEKLSAIAEQLGCSISDLFAEAESAADANALNEWKQTQGQNQGIGASEAPPRAYLRDDRPPNLDEALSEVEFMLPPNPSKVGEMAAMTFQGMMVRYGADRIVSAIESLTASVDRLRTEIERLKTD